MDFSNEKIIGKVIDIPNDDILPNRFQPRKYFDEVETLELADSIKEHGILQPIVVRQVGDKYEIIAGERRYKANILAGNDSIPAIVSNLDDKESSEIAVIENIQRQSLTPIEEAISYKRIIDMGYLTQEELARKIGKSQSAIANKIRLLKLSDNVQDALMSKKISERHARSLLKLDSLKKQDELLEKIINERLTVRKTDEEISKMNNQINSNNVNYTPKMEFNSNIGFQPIQNNESNVFTQSTPIDNQEVELSSSSVSPIMGTPLSSGPVTLENTNINNFDSSIQPTDNSNIMETPNFINNVQQPIMNEPNNNIFSVDTTPQTNSPINDDSFGQTVSTPINEDNNSTQISPKSNVLNENSQSTPNIFGTPFNSFDNFMPTEPKRNNEMNEQSLNNFNESNIFAQTPPISNSEIGVSSQPIVNEPIIETPKVADQIVTPVNENIQDEVITSTPISSFSIPNIQPPVVESQPTNDFNMFNIDSQNSINHVDNSVPSFIPEQPLGNVNIADDVAPVQNNNDIPLTNNIQAPIQTAPEPIIVSNSDNQFDPIMPEASTNEPTLDFKTIINLIRQCSQTIEKCGYRIDTDEVDMGGKYQVTFTIDK